MQINQLTEKVIGLAIKVHRTLGPGYLESVYKAALAYELRQAGIPFEKEKEMPVPYGPITLAVGFRCDFLIERQLIVECKAIKQLGPIDKLQTLNYVKCSKLQVGLLFNFHVMKLVEGGLKRIVNGFED